MKKLALLGLSLGLLVAAQPAAAQMMEMAPSKDVTLTGTVVDMSCKSVYGLTGDDHRMCAQVCADNGIALGIFADGKMYLPVSAAMPGEGANEMLKPHAEHTVTVTGKLIERGGINSLVIEEITMGGDR